MAESWKIGQKGVDNGVILLIAKAERKVRIEVGRGLEGKLTDLVSGRIIRAEIAPKFKAGDFDGGISAGVSALVQVAKGEYKAPRDLHQGKKGAPPLLTLLVFLAVAAVFVRLAIKGGSRIQRHASPPFRSDSTFGWPYGAPKIRTRRTDP